MFSAFEKWTEETKQLAALAKTKGWKPDVGALYEELLETVKEE